MPTFRQCLDADPAKFSGVTAEWNRAGSDMDRFVDDYADCMEGLADKWAGSDYDSAASWLPSVKAFNMTTQGAIKLGAATLQATGSVMQATVQVLKSTKQAAESAGYKVLDAPMVILGPRQWQQVSSAGPAAPAVLAAYQAGALAFNGFLMAQFAILNATDVAAAGGLHAAINTARAVGSVASAATPVVNTATQAADAWQNA
ncbi:hypothetical protein [Glycomyces buryatensis]|uniref:Uncharacterized protein n=1 Tax=Glycomyces buryatensis TaxID=2570927 RepID=A0A4S8QED8_9ACTN|nr:hypothetical protein [Glycomyces buryatensis]THV42987.1 hypothetical protein FAB82_03265 [Glycomyces buryatensis]